MVLKNARHELFAQAIASGKSPSEAYVLAGFKLDTGSASRLNTSASVRQRVAVLLSVMAARSVKQANYTREWVVNELIDNVEKAKAAADFSSANTALRLLGVERLMFIDRKETGQPGDFAAAQTPEAVLDLVAAELGEETARVLRAALGQQDAVEQQPIEPELRGDDTLQ